MVFGGKPVELEFRGAVVPEESLVGQANPFRGSVVPEELATEQASPAPEVEAESLHRPAARTALPGQEAPVENLFR